MNRTASHGFSHSFNQHLWKTYYLLISGLDAKLFIPTVFIKVFGPTTILYRVERM